ncbi:MAG: aldehyde dehydrogenase family protein [Sphingobacterium sp.]|nr:aldehyde dehydrogenase family protein [Sphingobacterium sp.]
MKRKADNLLWRPKSSMDRVLKVAALPKPCIAEAEPGYHIVQHETFAPILYLLKYKTIDEAVAIQNGVPQGTFIRDHDLNLRKPGVSFQEGSDCGIANMNIGTSGAEIGGAFVGERKLRAAGKVAATLGKLICAGEQTPLITFPAAASFGNRFDFLNIMQKRGREYVISLHFEVTCQINPTTHDFQTSDASADFRHPDHQ